MPQACIWVSDDLRRRMDGVTGVNWSQTASEAFERKLGEIAASKRRKTMKDVVQRLRASKLAVDSEEASEGYKAGQEWAKDQAGAKQLELLNRHMMEGGFVQPDGNAYGGAENFLFVIQPEHNGDRQQAMFFWDEALGDQDELPSDRFVQAFAEGALALWREVENQL